MTSSWLYLAAAIAFEICGTTAMKMADGYTRLIPTIAVFICYALAFSSLGLALKTIEVSVAYAIWSGVGTAAIAVIGMIWFQEQMTPSKALCIAMIITGVVGLNLTSRNHTKNENTTPTTARNSIQ